MVDVDKAGDRLNGIAIEQGAIDSVDDTAATYLQDWAGTEHEPITLKDLLQMNSGIDFVEDYRDPRANIAQMVTGEPVPAGLDLN